MDSVSEKTGWLCRFYRAWDHYKRGFGNLNGEFWFGLDKIHCLTVSSSNKLRVDIEDIHGATAFAEYSSFSVASENANYQLSLGSYTGERISVTFFVTVRTNATIGKYTGFYSKTVLLVGVPNNVPQKKNSVVHSLKTIYCKFTSSFLFFFKALQFFPFIYK